MADTMYVVGSCVACVPGLLKVLRVVREFLSGACLLCSSAVAVLLSCVSQEYAAAEHRTNPLEKVTDSVMMEVEVEELKLMAVLFDANASRCTTQHSTAQYGMVQTSGAARHSTAQQCTCVSGFCFRKRSTDCAMQQI